MHYQCLIVDDEKPLAESTAEYFNLFEVRTKAVFCGEDCLFFLEQHTAELILLDINLQNESGFDLCRTLRRLTQIPILFISARQSDDDILLALNVGGDDYIRKPYSLSVLLAKVKAVLRRFGKEPQMQYDDGRICIDFSLERVVVDGMPVRLKTMEWKLLSYLVRNRGRVILKEEYNVVSNNRVFAELVGGESGDVQLAVRDSAAGKRLKETVKKMPETAAVSEWYFDELAIKQDGKKVYCYISDDFSTVRNQQMLYDGRYPIHANEIAVNGRMAAVLGYELGDMITLVNENKTAAYLITGFIQSANSLGYDSCLTNDGYQLLKPKYEPSTYLVYLKDDRQAEAFIASVQEKLPEYQPEAVNVAEAMQSSLGMYQDIVAVIAKVILAVTAAVIALTLYLVVKTELVRSKKEIGIQKAIGFTTGQLIIQTACGFLPVVCTGAAAGCILGYVGINPVLSLLFSQIGLFRIQFAVLPELLIGLTVGISVFGYLIAVTAALMIRKITPYTLMNEV